MDCVSVWFMKSMKRQQVFLTTVLLFCQPLLFAQLGGEHTYKFLSLPSSPRQAALGGVIATLYDSDANNGFVNPAAIHPDMGRQLALNYAPYFNGINWGSASYVLTWDRNFKAIHFGAQYIDYGTFDGRDEWGNPMGDFTGNEVALSAAFAFNIPWTRWFVGASMKLISSKLESYQSMGMATDLGVYYRDEVNEIELSLVVRNLGTQISTYDGVREKLPLAVHLGVSQQLQYLPLRWHLTLQQLQNWNLAFSIPDRESQNLDGSYTNTSPSFIKELSRHLLLAAELFPDRPFSIQLGYNFLRGEELRILELRNFSGLSFGVAMKFNRFKFQFSHARYTAAGNSSFFGTNIYF